MRMRRLATMLGLACLISSTTGALAAPAEVLAAVNLRTGPGAQYYAIMVLPPGAPVEIYGCLDDENWCDVGYGRTRGWIASRYLGTVRNWSPERRILRPPVLTPPPIYREPQVYTNPPPVYREPEWAPPDVYQGEVYIEPPPGYVYRPPVVAAPPMPDLPQPDVGVYPSKPRVQTAPPVVASTPPATQPSTPPPTVTQPSTTPQTGATGQSSASSAQPAAPADAKPKYGSAVGKPGAPCKWVNGVCRND
ncbi:SH3 domain-containing protein [Pleomorphomonas sp. JP5]|uniref:SH3 domain-containing protein n=1 Tax=Pleomorphomonas sp. JP5 TaxID=2942998 RepID=UPI002043978A|nr:SH3 domain-containing protein [Pleomorphomonas sp. JP5]MCM5557732.1 SH3 domain-containing protein [Pleomorphomonas sp. JP5]